MNINNLYSSLKSFKNLDSLIKNEIRESEVLEYKNAENKFSDKQRTELPKDISAMANSNGGTLIFGIDTDTKDTTKPTKITGINPTNIETFDRVINSQIRPEIKGLQKKIITNHDKTMQCMIISVPKSEVSPHQNLYDKKYYRRSLAESIPMEHDIIELHFGKRLRPILDIIVEKLKNQELNFNNESGFSNLLSIDIFINNIGRKMGRFITALFFFPNSQHIKIQSNKNFVRIDDLYKNLEDSKDKQIFQFIDNNACYHIGTQYFIGNFLISINKNWDLSNSKDPILEWSLFADEMPKRDGKIFKKDLI